MNYQEKLINKAIAGDEKAFEELYKSTYKKVHFTCKAFLKNDQDVADIEQEIYITVLNCLETLQDKSKFESWLGKITINKCRDYLKKNKPILVEDEILAEVLEEDDELKLPEEYVSNKAKRKILMDIIRDCLSDTLYQTVILFYFHDMSAAEIAEAMECPVGTITSRLCMARTKIKEAVLAYEEKSGDKLHGIILVPVLGMLFKEEAMAMEPAFMCEKILKSSSTKITTAKVAKTGGITMLKTLKAKIILGVTIVVLIGGGITVALLNQSDKKNETFVEHSVDESKKDEESSNKAENSGQVVVGSDITDSQDEDTSLVEDDAKFEITKVGTKVVDNELITIEYAGSKWDEWNNYRVYFDATNKCDEELSLEVNRYFSVNGFQEYPGDYEIIEPGATIEYMIMIDSFFIEKDRIENIDYLDFVFGMRPQITGGITEERVLIIPEDSKNGPVPQGYQLCETDEVVLDTDEAYLVIKGYNINEYGTLYVDFYFENRTDKEICLGNASSLVNGETLRGFTVSDYFFFPKCGCIDTFYCWDFDEKFSGEIEKLETDIMLYSEEFEFDYETGERKILFKEHITIEKTFQNN